MISLQGQIIGTSVRLTGKTALITGAASGIGQATACLFAREGARLALSDVAPMRETLEQLDEVQEIRHSHHVADVGDSAEVEAMVQEVVREHGRLDLVVSNAGINRDGFVENLSDEDWDEVIRVNLGGCFNLARAAFRLLAEGGSLVATSSVSARGNLGQANYAASKAGLAGLVRSLALEGASRAIRVNAVAPGFTDTPMVRSIPAKVREKLLSRIPLARLAMPVEIAKAILFLSSDEASYITGQVLYADGGASVGL